MVAALEKAEARIDVTKRKGAALPGPTPKRPRLASRSQEAAENLKVTARAATCEEGEA
jgi:hypothetical protein